MTVTMPRAAAHLTILVAVLVGTPSATRAQWLQYPTAGVPRTASGAPNLAAPAPRTADGRPDLSGLWELKKDKPCPPDGCPDNQLGEQFFNIGFGLKGGLPFQPWAAALVKTRTEQNGKDDPLSRCLPGGIVKMHTGPFLNKFLQLPGLVVVLNEREATFRQIFTDGRPLPADPQPSWRGYSTGRWEGDTLVVQSNGFRDGIWLDRNGSPLSEGATITERFRRMNFGQLEIAITVDDRTTYTAPWTVTVNQVLVPDTDILEFVCLENEKDAAHLVGK
jgi:hypothetical protein